MSMSKNKEKNVKEINNKDNYRVYMHTNIINNKKYIGITKRQPEIRYGCNGYKYKRSPHFYNAIVKYGWENFNHIILFENLSKKDEENKEIELIKLHKTIDKNFGYNIQIGGNCGNSGNTMSDETKEKIRKAHKGKRSGKNNGFYGKRHSLESIEKMVTSRKYYKHSEETIKKLKATSINKNKGKFLGGNSVRARKVICLETNIIYDSMSDAEKNVNTGYSSIASCCSHRYKHAGTLEDGTKLTWMYFEEYLDTIKCDNVD